jgi:3-oxoacyl-[acyl-carrier protein] reductase
VSTPRRARAVLEASERACWYFIERGDTSATVADVAAAVGLNERTFYRYFATKPDVVRPVLDWGAATMADRIAEHPELSVKEAALRSFDETLGGELAERTRGLFPLLFADPALRSVLLAVYCDAEDELRLALSRRTGLDPLSGPLRLAAATLVAVTRVAIEIHVETGRDPVEALRSCLELLPDHLVGEAAPATPARADTERGSDPMARLEGRTAFITGAASGLGKAQALRFAQEGARIVAADLNEKGAAETAAEIRQAGGEAIGVVIDVTDEASVAAAVQRGLAEFGLIDTLSNTAGMFDGFAQLLETDKRRFDRVLDVNLDGMFNVSKALLPHMIEHGKGVIVNIASGAGLRGGGGGIAYTASKHGVVGFTRQLAAAYGRDGIRVNAIAPGLIDTPMVADFSGTEETQAGLKAQPGGRLGRPEDIANAALFLASDEADFIHAVTLSVDGGLVDTL